MISEKKIDLWVEIGNKCLRQANKLLDGSSSIESVKKAKDLVEIAVSIDTLNLRWAEQAQCTRGYHLGRKEQKTTQSGWEQ